MAKNNKKQIEIKLSNDIIKLVGGTSNIESVKNCMTRTRLTLKDMKKPDDSKVKKLDSVMGVVKDDEYQIVLGTGKCKRIADLINDQLTPPKKSDKTKNIISKSKVQTKTSTSIKKTIDWKDYKNKIKGINRNEFFKKMQTSLSKIGQIFTPLLPAIFAAGLLMGLGSLLESIAMSSWGDNGSGGADPTKYPDAMNVFINLFKGLGGGFLSYLAVFVGWRTASVLGATPALGGMVGGISLVPQITGISKLLGWYDTGTPLNSILIPGKGGIIGVMLAVLLMSYIEKFIRKNTHDILDIIVVPILTILITGSILIFALMPFAGILTTGLMYIFDFFISSQFLGVRIVGGYILAATFLFLVVFGLHHALIPIYATQLKLSGEVTLFPILAMAGAGQVGASIAIWLKSKKLNKEKYEPITKQCITGIIPGVLGVGEPLIYGLTLPMGIPFLSAGLGAGFGGAFIAALGVAASSWGPSGFSAMLLMNSPQNIGLYVFGLLISIFMGTLITFFMVKQKHLDKVVA